MTKKQVILLYILFFAFFYTIPSEAQPVNPNATKEARDLMAFLRSVYGQKILSGQVDDKYLQYIKDATGGKEPAIMGYDFNGICPSQGGNNDANKAIRWVRERKGIAQFQWHWISPDANGDFYTKNYNLANALADTNSSSYKNLIRDIDLAAVQIKKLQDAGVPILWRPLHEAEGGWFWWGMSGGTACKKLWRLMYDRYTNYHKLNNLIWVWNSYGLTKENWYPGDDVVDIIAWDYPDYSINGGSWSQYQRLFGQSGKMFGIGEDGKLTDPAVLANQPWLYFLTWAYMIQDNNTKDWINKVYNDPRVLTLSDLQPGTRALAGYDRIIFDEDDNGYEMVTLDGSSSRTDSGSIVSYDWSEKGIKIASGDKPTVKLNIGVHNIGLTITTNSGESKTDSVKITIKRFSLSYNKFVRVLTTENSQTTPGANAVDGDYTTKWSSIKTDPQWIAIDMGKASTVRQAVIFWDEGSARDYTIDMSDDGLKWTTIASYKNMAAGLRVDSALNLSGSGRFIRVYGSSRSNSLLGYSIQEFEVYGSPSTGIAEEKGTSPKKFRLSQNYPNPFNPGTKISFTLPEGRHTTLKIYDTAGKEVRTVIDENLPKGEHNVHLDFTGLPSGTYIYRIQSGEFRGSGKMTLLK